MKNNKLIKLFNRSNSSDGYTLTELLIGASISVVVIGAAGMGLMNMLQGNKASTAEGDRITEVNRALEFISDEVRRAERIETNPSANLPTGFDPSNKEVVLALELPDLEQDNPDDRVIYYVRPKPDNTWLGPNVIYRYGPPLDTAGGSYTDKNWVEQALIDRVNDQTITPTCDNGTAIAAEGFAACVDSGEKVAQIYVNGQFADYGGDTYQADVQVYARATEANIEGKDSKITFDILKASGSSKVKIIGSNMGCNPTGQECDVTTQFYQQDGTTPIGSPISSGDNTSKDLNIGTNDPFVVTVSPSVPSNLNNPYPSYFDASGNLNSPQTGLQNNNKDISVKVDLSKDYLQENPLTIVGNDFKIDQVVLLGDKSPLPQNDAWNPDPQNNPNLFKKLTDILGSENFLDKDGDLQLEANQYLLVFEVGQTDTAHKGFDLQDQIILITVD